MKACMPGRETRILRGGPVRGLHDDFLGDCIVLVPTSASSPDRRQGQAFAKTCTPYPTIRAKGRTVEITLYLKGNDDQDKTRLGQWLPPEWER